MKLSTLGLMRKVGCLVLGFDAVAREIKAPASKIQGVLISSDLSDKTKKELEYVRDRHRYGLEIVSLEAEMSEIEGVIGKKTGIIAVMDLGFWKMV